MRRFSLPDEVPSSDIFYVDPTQKQRRGLRRRTIVSSTDEQGSLRWTNSCSSTIASTESCSSVQRCESVESASSASVSLPEEDVNFEELILHSPTSVAQAHFPSSRCIKHRHEPLAASEAPRPPRRSVSNSSMGSGVNGIPAEVMIVVQEPASTLATPRSCAVSCDHPSLPDCTTCHKQKPAAKMPPKMPRRGSHNSTTSCGMSHSNQSRGSSRLNSTDSPKSEKSALLADYWDWASSESLKEAQDDLDASSNLDASNNLYSTTRSQSYWDWEETMDDSIIRDMIRSYHSDGDASSSCNIKRGTGTAAEKIMANYWDWVSNDPEPVIEDASSQSSGSKKGVAAKVMANYWDWVSTGVDYEDEEDQKMPPSRSSSKGETHSQLSSVEASRRKREHMLYEI